MVEAGVPQAARCRMCIGPGNYCRRERPGIRQILLSVIVNFYVEFQARHAVEDIRKQVATKASVLRDEMTLAGFAAFLDPPKEGIGDNQYVTQKVARDGGMA